jgi:hypothetical protein
MPLGEGFWYDRRARRYYKINEHATDATQHPRRFRAQPVSHLDPVADREAIVRYVAAQGFIRLRLHRDRLGFEFHGQADDSVAVLRRFIRRHEVGPVVQVNISDFASGRSVVASAAAVLASTSAADLGLVGIRGRRPS